MPEQPIASTSQPLGARYWVDVADELLPDLEELLPACLRLLHVSRDGAPDGSTRQLVEDSEAPPELDGRLVCPAIQATYDDAGTQTGATVFDRQVVN